MTVIERTWNEPSPTDIEYTRTDVFIDKAEAWLIKNQKGFILTDKDIKDFKYFMKGDGGKYVEDSRNYMKKEKI